MASTPIRKSIPSSDPPYKEAVLSIRFLKDSSGWGTRYRLSLGIWVAPFNEIANGGEPRLVLRIGEARHPLKTPFLFDSMISGRESTSCCDGRPKSDILIGLLTLPCSFRGHHCHVRASHWLALAAGLDCACAIPLSSTIGAGSTSLCIFYVMLKQYSCIDWTPVEVAAQYFRADQCLLTKEVPEIFGNHRYGIDGLVVFAPIRQRLSYRRGPDIHGRQAHHNLTEGPQFNSPNHDAGFILPDHCGGSSQLQVPGDILRGI
ncbi:hypothetical protein LZ30DRAFT_798737 [Colletotrichum cereale]|nr:hypothetical protein LZ30DRAFT_798737 [Colletotrichum cereale]